MVFARAKIRKIGHDHQAPSFLFFLDFKRNTRRKQAPIVNFMTESTIFKHKGVSVP